MPRPFREDIARRFPLVPHPKPCCHPLEIRVRQVADLADTATHDGPDQVATSAAQAHNFAALIASDCGLPALAHNLCRRQFRSARSAAWRLIRQQEGVVDDVA